jgi:hypothetical protein
MAGPQSYTAAAVRFAQDSLWDDFLEYHYTGREFDPATNVVAVPRSVEAIRAPATGGIQLSQLSLSAQTAAPGQPVLMSADMSGENIGYVKLFVGYYDQSANSIQVTDMDYLESSDTREIDGVYYPVWNEDFTMEFEWEPIVFAINDGVNSVPALLTPLVYGASPEDAVYTVEGQYTFADGGETLYARLFFRDGELRKVFSFSQANGNGAPREIIPQAGDTFTILEKWMDLDQNGKVSEVVLQEGATLTFGNRMFTWEELYAAPGEYVIGFIVEDLDGNAYEVYTPIVVQ